MMPTSTPAAAKPATSVQLNPYVLYDPKTSASSHNFKSKLWTIAAITTAVAFTAFATFAIAYSTVYWAVHLPIITLVTLTMGLPTSFRLFKGMWDRANLHAEERKIDLDLVKRMAKVEVKDKNGIPKGLTEGQYRQLFARIGYFSDLGQAKLAEASSKMKPPIELNIKDKIQKIDPKDYTVEKTDFSNPEKRAVFQALQVKRVETHQLLGEAAIALLKAYYLLKLLQEPTEKRPFSAFVREVPLSLPQRMVAATFGDPSAHILVKSASNKGYSSGEIFEKQETLMKEIFELNDTNSG